MSKNRYISDVLGSNFTPISMVSEDATTTPAKQLIKMGRARPRTRAYGFSPFQAAPAEDGASISNDGTYDINGEKTDDINGEKTDDDTDDINGDPLGTEEFLTHLFNLGCTQETVSIVESHLDQATFGEIMKAPDAHMILGEQLKVTCGITRAKVSQWWRIQDLKRKAVVKSSQEVTRTLESYSQIRRQEIPKFPVTHSGRGHCSVISWKEYGIAVNGWLQILGAHELAELAKVIFKHPDDFKAHSSSIKLSTEREVAADAQWAPVSVK